MFKRNDKVVYHGPNGAVLVRIIKAYMRNSNRVYDYIESIDVGICWDYWNTFKSFKSFTGK